MTRLTVLPEENDVRLDRVLERLLPGMGLRGRRRLCELGLVEVNGRPAPPSRKMRPGDVAEVREAAPADASTPSAETQTASGRARLFPEDRPRLVTCTPHLAAVYKPASMHTEALAGKPGVSLQAMLPEIIGEACHASLLNRLDFPTSGLATAALDELGERQYRDAQERGLTVKRYLALLEGALEHDALAAQKLLLKNRSRVLVELAEHPDKRRHTEVHPLAVLNAADLCRRLHLKEHGWTGRLPSAVTLAGCTILKGARHQIRAHCSALGHPLLGDRRYGAQLHPDEKDDEAFFLHHGRLIMPALDALALPVWLPLLDGRTAAQAEHWLKR
ncbi:pseudouridine synthase [uncultured Mailhella sp.]|uniref:pseudouridine synthase n=1 Tax=uncultured Mailhella sp. TaxID=1981031 RepID=UPI003209300F